MRIRRHALAGFVVLTGSALLLSSGSPARADLAPASSDVGPGQIEPPNATLEFEELGPLGQQQRRAVVRLRTIREADVPGGPVEFRMPKTFLAKEPVVFEGMIVPVDPHAFRGAIIVEMFIVRRDEGHHELGRDTGQTSRRQDVLPGGDVLRHRPIRGSTSSGFIIS